jgi:hypothetical protein
VEQWPSSSAWNSDLALRTLGRCGLSTARTARRVWCWHGYSSTATTLSATVPRSRTRRSQSVASSLLRNSVRRVYTPGCRPGDSRKWHLRRTSELEEVLDLACVEDFVVDNGDRRIRDVAVDVLVRSQWISPDQQPQFCDPSIVTNSPPPGRPARRAALSRKCTRLPLDDPLAEAVAGSRTRIVHSAAVVGCRLQLAASAGAVTSPNNRPLQSASRGT